MGRTSRAASISARRPGRQGPGLGLGGAALVAAAAGVAAVVLRRRTAPGPDETGAAPIHAHGVVTVRGTPEQVYARWRDLPKLPSVLSHLHEVRVLDSQRSRWTALGPDNKPLTWDVEITDDVPGRELAWRSLPPAPVPTEGHVRFSPARGGRGTEVHLDLSYSPGLGRDAEAAVFSTAHERFIRRDLRRFKKASSKREPARTGS